MVEMTINVSLNYSYEMEVIRNLYINNIKQAALCLTVLHHSRVTGVQTQLIMVARMASL